MQHVRIKLSKMALLDNAYVRIAEAPVDCKVSSFLYVYLDLVYLHPQLSSGLITTRRFTIPLTSSLTRTPKRRRALPPPEHYTLQRRSLLHPFGGVTLLFNPF